MCMQVFPVAKRLADCVVPAEYGIVPDYKLRIGKKIASELIGKLLADLQNSCDDCDAAATEVAGMLHPAAPSEGSGVHGSGDEVLSSQVWQAPRTQTPAQVPSCRPHDCMWLEVIGLFYIRAVCVVKVLHHLTDANRPSAPACIE